MIRAEQQGRRLVLTVEVGDDEPVIEPFVILPLPMETGRLLTAEYLAFVTPGGLPGIEPLTPERKVEIFQVALDGADPETHAPHLDADGQPIIPQYKRAEAQLTQAEGEELLIKAFMWHTIVGIDGILAFDEAGGGTAGALKAIRLLASRTGLLPSPISHSSVSENLTQQADTSGTSTPPAGGRRDSALARLPLNRRSIRQATRKG